MSGAGRHAYRAAGLRRDAQPIFSEDWVATAWQYVPTAGDEPKPVDLAAPLRALHSLDELDVALPSWSPIEKFRRRLNAAAALPPKEAAGLERWSRTELGDPGRRPATRSSPALDEVEEDLDRVGVAAAAGGHPRGRAHGEHFCRHQMTTRSPARSLLLCDLDGICIGPREWDLVPTAHGATRFGRSAASIGVCRRLRGRRRQVWAGWPVLRRVRELQLVTSTIDALAGRPDVARELAHRLRSLFSDDLKATWRRYRVELEWLAPTQPIFAIAERSREGDGASVLKHVRGLDQAFVIPILRVTEYSGAPPD